MTTGETTTTMTAETTKGMDKARRPTTAQTTHIVGTSKNNLTNTTHRELITATTKRNAEHKPIIMTKDEARDKTPT
eukprot:6567239-Prorocentrum_lima.AAC.1